MPQLVQTTALTKISRLTKRLRVIQGGTSASKTFSILAYLIHVAQTNDDLVISVVSESLPHLKLGAIRDFRNIMRARKYWRDDAWTDKVYTFETGSLIEFFSVDSDKAHGPRRDVLFLNEANNVSYDIYTQLETRTRQLVILDFNPTHEFWLYEQVMPYVDHDFLKLTYRDNEALEPAIVRSIESRRHNANYWRVYGLGEIGTLEGQVYTNWHVLSGPVPEAARMERYGLDFGYTADPSALVAVYRWNKAFIVDEVAYQKGLSNKQLADIVNAQPGYDRQRTLVVADSAEPKSIDEIAAYGVAITGSSKGAGSVNQGIQLVQDQMVFYTPRSVNLIKEARNYTWRTDRDGKPLNVPTHEFSHGKDAERYALVDLVGKPASKVIASTADKGMRPYTSGLLDSTF